MVGASAVSLVYQKQSLVDDLPSAHETRFLASITKNVRILTNMKIINILEYNKELKNILDLFLFYT